MKRYFFNLSDGTQEPDNDGTEYSCDQDAQNEAVRYAGEVMKHEPERLGHGHMRVDVSDEAKSMLFSVTVALEVGSRQ